MKRAQGLPITTIIIAALGLLVLVVIGAIFGGQIGKFGRVSSECQARCVVGEETTCIAGVEKALSGKYIKEGQQGVPADELEFCNACCVSVG